VRFKKNIFFVFLALGLSEGILWSSSAKASRAKEKPTLFQTTIQQCLPSLKLELKKVQTLSQLYASIEQKYLLTSSTVLAREVVFKDKYETKKLKYQNGQLTLYKILDEDDQRLVPIANDVRQKSATTESYLNQLLIRADIQSDWMQSKEFRSGSWVVIVTKEDQVLTGLKIESFDLKNKLECSQKTGADVCSCLPVK